MCAKAEGDRPIHRFPLASDAHPLFVCIDTERSLWAHVLFVYAGYILQSRVAPMPTGLGGHLVWPKSHVLSSELDR